MFKPKNNSQITLKKNINTLDNRHEELVKQFLGFEKEIPKIRNKIEKLKKLKKLTNDISTKLEYSDQINVLKIQLKNYKNQLKNYLLNNSKYIFDYFETKKNISMGMSKTTILNHFFDKNLYTEDEKHKNNCNILVNKYMQNIDPTLINLQQYIQNFEVCQKCSGELIAIDNEGICVCNKCGYLTKYLTENEKSSYKEPPKEVCYYVYKRINHFKEILAQFQAKETTYISDEVLDRIKSQIKKERISFDEITNDKAKDILKKLGYSNYYEHISFIKEKLGIKPPVMTPELEERLCNLFIQIQGPYSKYCPEDRVNFLNYYYTIYKLCELINHTEFLLHFPMLKDRDKRIEQDEIWKKICLDLDWKFLPTL
jgi:hypothetical protein